MKEAGSQFAANQCGLYIFIKSTTSLKGKYIDISRSPSALLYFPAERQFSAFV